MKLNISELDLSCSCMPKITIRPDGSMGKIISHRRSFDEVNEASTFKDIMEISGAVMLDKIFYN